jgi:hypothetical protein
MKKFGAVLQTAIRLSLFARMLGKLEMRNYERLTEKYILLSCSCMYGM